MITSKKMSKMAKLTLVGSIAAGLIGCGGGSSDEGSTGKSVLLQGKAIDGYIVGATVYLDLNFNSQLDSNEPNVITKEEGEFDLTVPSQYGHCAEYVPVVVDVPIGAVDTDDPENPIEEAYSMVFPPKFALSTDQDLLNLTPLTSVVWKQVEQELRGSGAQELSCDLILAKQSLREDIAQRLTDQEVRVANRYNVTVTQLYGDYVESGETDIHDLAKYLVPGLQQSYVETKALIDSRPDADFAWVEYFLGGWSSDNGHYSDGWYRNTMIQTSNGNLVSETYKVNDAFENIKLFDKFTMKTTVRDGINIEQTVNIEEQKDGYSCSVEEWLETIEQNSYGIRNIVSATTSNWSACDAISGESADVNEVTQSLLTKTYSNDNELISYSEHLYYPENDSGFKSLINITGTINVSDLTEISGTIKSTDFRNEDGYGADFWFRNKNEFTDDAQIMTEHNISGEWTRRTIYSNGTHMKECGDGEFSMSEDKCK